MIMNENGITNGTQAYFDPFFEENKILDAWGLPLEDLESILAEAIEALDNTVLILNF